MIRIDATGCPLRQAVAAWRGIAVEFSVLGVDREAFVPMSEVIAMHGITVC